ncbi:F-box and WD domain protein [Aspergillus clavatus NRRL 1]|uniref:F-box and WD domain protein n=1 Tax=Aspergillus clavatus (strain ATCC 1007 / CBS 513.65 / DSM 816 / NCTC 3887 / NRRL 1 / QM 1276 / 107) TaxID=344612 RepID=A1CU24_ASPCL|nr:F-box and WD domain protein [Aspergillus clavatus NRRL 1]EAW06811.1 F-box and WD domain protein [Aspergillus clavatus NRRL 1]
MQSELTAVLQQSSQAEKSPGETYNFTQHGHELCGENHRVSGLPHHVEVGDSSADPDSIKDTGHSSLKSVSSETFIPSSPSIGGASQFGNIIPQSPSKQADFRSKRVAFDTQPRVALGALPNEVLTHILSHLPPPSLSSIALVSRRFHSLVTTPHAWRIAFSRYFPGPYTVENGARLSTADASDNVASNKRYFSRLTALASWRSEYILRTRLLRSLSRGKPAQFEPSKKTGTVRSANVRHGSAVVTYTSQLMYPVSHLGGSFGAEDAKKVPLFIHGASEQGIASASDPSAVKAGTWGVSDHQMFRHFADLYPGDAEYGLGAGDLAGQPNSMDVSQPYGMVYGEGCPQGRSYFISTAEQRGRFLDLTESSSHPKQGIPALNPATTSITAVWIAKSLHILKMTGGLMGMLTGSSAGILSGFALGPHPTYEKRFERGQVTAKWAICPGVPIIGIAIDDNYSKRRSSRGRIWAMVLNALGEIYYLTDIPRQPEVATKLSVEELDQLAWKTGRSVRWELVEATRRIARSDPFNREPVDGSYSPHSSSDSMKLDEQQIVAETKEIERFLKFRPKHFRKVCDSWDMRRQLRVDFAGDDGHGAGESVLVISRGVGEGEKASIRRFTRVMSKDGLFAAPGAISQPHETTPRSLFGGPAHTPIPSVVSDTGSLPPSRASTSISETRCSVANTEWRMSDFTFGDRKSVQITTSALDQSTYAVLTADEDPLLGMSGSSAFSSAMSSPLPHMQQSSPKPEVPGQRGRYIAVGTSTGLVLVWDMRAPTAKNTDMINPVSPLRIIQTDSPQVSCVALTSLYLVHGGNDGLVQAWDPLASTTRPIRTINSRFSSRARRRLVQAEASVQGVGNNYFACGAICLDPDPTVLRGMVALGTHLRFWAYSSSGADQYKSSKRRLRRGLRGSNTTAEGQRFSNSGRGAIRDYIADERVEMERQKIADEKERAHLSNRFGVDLLGPDVSEEQLLAYAQLLSEEAFTSEAGKRGEIVESSMVSTSPSDTIGRNDSSVAADDYSSSSSPYQNTEDDLAPDIAEAIRLSLLDEGPPSETPSFSLKFSKDFQSSHSDISPSELAVAESSRQQELDDLELAIQLSLAESQSLEQAESQQRDEYPSSSAFPSSSDNGKGKGRAL